MCFHRFMDWCCLGNRKINIRATLWKGNTVSIFKTVGTGKHLIYMFPETRHIYMNFTIRNGGPIGHSESEHYWMKSKLWKGSRTNQHRICRTALRWRHNECDSVSNHQPHDCLLNRFFRRRSKKTSKFRVTGLCVGSYINIVYINIWLLFAMSFCLGKPTLLHNRYIFLMYIHKSCILVYMLCWYHRLTVKLSYIHAHIYTHMYIYI